MPNILLPIPHQRQRTEADCLAACAAMALTHLGISIAYDQLLNAENVLYKFNAAPVILSGVFGAKNLYDLC